MNPKTPGATLSEAVETARQVEAAFLAPRVFPQRCSAWESTTQLVIWV